ncbi:porin PorA family protein, partial [Corynebacterium accolens]|nr:porin PorA family protein [Corynebacterium accolens]
MFKPESLERFGLSPTEHVILEPFYTVKRDVWVEPTTGTILDVHEDIKIFLATDADQARQMVEENDTADRALFQ